MNNNNNNNNNNMHISVPPCSGNCVKIAKKRLYLVDSNNWRKMDWAYSEAWSPL